MRSSCEVYAIPLLVPARYHFLCGSDLRAGRHFSLFSSLNRTMSARFRTGDSSNPSRNLGMQMFLKSQTDGLVAHFALADLVRG